MQYKRKKSKKIILISISAIVAVLICGAAAYAYWLQTEPGKKKQTEAAQQAEDTKNKKDFVENTEKQSPDTTPPKVPDNPNNISIQAKDEANGTVTILTKLTNYSDGQCSLKISNGTKQYSADVNVIFQPEYSTCAGFSVPKSQLGSGTWDIRLVVSSKGGEVTSSQKVDIK